jgi:TetR/AcrR family transcriptional repressor of nem operon
MAGRPRLLEEDQMLEKALEMFWENGYEATSMEDLLHCMSLNKGSLYHVFGSKRELFSKTLDFFGKKSQNDIERKILEVESPVVGIKNFFLEVASSKRRLHEKGCFMGNTVAELAGIDKQLKDKAIQNLKNMEDLFYRYIEKAKNAKELKTQEDSRVIARYLVNLWNGINITRRIYPTGDALQSVINLQLSILI